MKLRRQQGVAIVTALLLSTLAVTIVTSLFWLQQVQVRSMENQRLQLQTRWILRGALDLSRLVLSEDQRYSPTYTQLNGVWATPLEETRLDDYVERERLQGESFNATLLGRMIDAQSRYNLGNLATGKQINTAEVEVFGRLLNNLRLDSGLAQSVASMVAQSNPASGKQEQKQTSSNEQLGLVRVEDLLAVSGFTPAAIEKLRDFVIVLPTSSLVEVNVNTAPAEVLSALVVGLSLSEASSIVNARKTVYYRDNAGFTSLPQMSGKRVGGVYGVYSNYFLAYSRVKLDRATLETQSLLKRGDGPLTSVVWIREY